MSDSWHPGSEVGGRYRLGSELDRTPAGAWFDAVDGQGGAEVAVLVMRADAVPDADRLVAASARAAGVLDAGRAGGDVYVVAARGQHRALPGEPAALLAYIEGATSASGAAEAGHDPQGRTMLDSVPAPVVHASAGRGLGKAGVRQRAASGKPLPFVSMKPPSEQGARKTPIVPVIDKPEMKPRIRPVPQPAVARPGSLGHYAPPRDTAGRDPGRRTWLYVAAIAALGAAIAVAVTLAVHGWLTSP